MAGLSKNQILDQGLSSFKFIINTIDPDMRSDEQCVAVIKFLQDLGYLSKGDPTDFIELAKNIDVRTFREGQVVCKEGDIGEEVYYILRGKVEGVSVIGGNGKFDIGAGREFGEIAVIRGEPRASTITAAQETDMLIIRKDMYIKYCGKQRIQFVREVQNFYEENYLMRGVSHDSKKKLANKSFPKKYLANQTLVRQGDKADTIFFISKGGVKLLRNIKKRHLKNLELNAEYKKEMLELPDHVHLDVQTLCRQVLTLQIRAASLETMRCLMDCQCATML